jgi:hypothetical protein
MSGDKVDVRAVSGKCYPWPNLVALKSTTTALQAWHVLGADTSPKAAL